jgi:cytochrome c oxidase assembly factor CtaG
MTTAELIRSGWTWKSAALPLAAAAFAAYRWRYRTTRRWPVFAAALAVIVLTLTSPLNALADGILFSAHMAQHILLLVVAPALLLLGLPRTVSLAVRPRWLGRPWAGWLAGVGAMWLWHAPALCDAAVASPPIHALQTGSLLLLGTLFWRQTLAPREAERLSPPAAVAYLGGACLACSVLGIMLTFSPVTVCSIYAASNAAQTGPSPLIDGQWGLTPQRDQQIGGLLMWVPMCLIYLAAILAQVGRWFAEVPHPSAVNP